jgi:hypothetical protein
MSEEENKNKSNKEEEEDIEVEVKKDTCPMDNCENKKNWENKKGRCDACQKWWYESKRIFFGVERRCIKCQEIFEPETRDTTRDSKGYICENCRE